MAYLKLMKLLYLSNRQSILKHGRMIGEDSLYSEIWTSHVEYAELDSR